MNKYEEAKKWLDEIWKHDDWAITEIRWCAVDQLRELIKKETPMKVNKKKVNRTEIKVGNGIFKLDYMWSCPNCETWISPSHDENYCSKCGQRLEYEDD